MTMKNLFLNFIKALIILNAIFWIFIIALLLDSYWAGAIKLNNIDLMLCIAFLIVMGPVVVYWIANSLFKFDIKKKKIFFERNKYAHQLYALEIFENKFPNWLALFACLFCIVAFGIVSFINSNNSYWLFYFIFIFLPFFPLTIATFLRATDKNPVLVLTNSKIAYKYWKFEYILFSDIEDVNLLKERFLKITVNDSRTLKDIPWNMRDIDTRKLNYDREDLLEIIKEKKLSPQTSIQKIIAEKSKKGYIPIKILTGEHVLRLIISLLVLVYPIYELIDKLIIPAKNENMYLYPASAFMMIVIATMVIANLSSLD